MSEKTDKMQPMDATIRERQNGIVATNSKRVCWAIKTLVAEMADLFPETPVEYSNHDGRNTALDVTFDLSVLDDEDRSTLIALFTLFDFNADPRIEAIIAEGQRVLVSMKANPRTQDSRESFGLAEAWGVLTDGDDDDDSGEDGFLTAMVGDAPWTDAEFLAAEGSL